MQIKFFSGCNILIGENAIGKTQLLKLLYEGSTDKQPLSMKHVSIQKDANAKVTYIPVKDMLTHAKGFISMSEKYRNFPFGKELIDIIRKSEQWQLKEIPSIARDIVPRLERMMGWQGRL